MTNLNDCSVSYRLSSHFVLLSQVKTPTCPLTKCFSAKVNKSKGERGLDQSFHAVIVVAAAPWVDNVPSSMALIITVKEAPQCKQESTVYTMPLSCDIFAVRWTVCVEKNIAKN